MSKPITVVTVAAALFFAGCSPESPKAAPSEATQAAAKSAPRAACKNFPKDKEADAEGREFAKVPDALSEVVQASDTTLTVHHADGQTSCADIAAFSVVAYDSLVPGKLLGVSLQGYEAVSYLVFDLRRKSEPVDTAETPTLSPTGKLLASAHINELVDNDLNGIGVWQVKDEGIFPVPSSIESSALHGKFEDVKVAGWSADESCVRIIGRTSEEEPKEVQFHLNLKGKSLMAVEGQCS